MKYLITGIDHAKGNHLRVEIEAASKAAAEKRAREMGIDVQHVQETTAAEPPRDRQTHRGEHVSGGSAWVWRWILIECGDRGVHRFRLAEGTRDAASVTSNRYQVGSRAILLLKKRPQQAKLVQNIANLVFDLIRRAIQQIRQTLLALQQAFQRVGLRCAGFSVFG